MLKVLLSVISLDLFISGWILICVGSDRRKVSLVFLSVPVWSLALAVIFYAWS